MIRRSGALRCLSFTAVLFAALQLSPIASPFWAAYAFQCSPCPETCTSPYCPYSMSGPVDFCTYPISGCPASYHVSSGSGNEGSGCCCYDYSPVLIDLDGGQFDNLTSAENGVVFDITARGRPLRVAWTRPGSRQGWLALDRNGNGSVDNGAELFGNHTPQVPSVNPNGFRALAVYDSRDKGGNGDGVISREDRIYRQLWIWVDENHNGRSEPRELLSLGQAGVTEIDLEFQTAGRLDRHGNDFRYRARVKDAPGAHVNRWAWDIFLTVVDTTSGGTVARLDRNRR